MKEEKSKKIAFLDRDGVINKCAPPHEYVTSIDNFSFNPGIFEVVTKLQNDGFEIIIVTNQRGVARNKFSEDTLQEIHAHMVSEFNKNDIAILDIFYCPHELDSCDCRKPLPGLLIKATTKYSVDIPHSLIISDSMEDVIMGKNFGLGIQIFVPKDIPSSSLDSL